MSSRGLSRAAFKVARKNSALFTTSAKALASKVAAAPLPTTPQFVKAQPAKAGASESSAPYHPAPGAGGARVPASATRPQRKMSGTARS